jgi:hypothetical protein
MVASSFSPARQAAPPLRPHLPFRSNPVAEVPDGALELGMIAGDLAPGAVEGGGAGLARPALPRPFSSNPVAEMPEEALELGMSRASHR